MPRGQGMAFLVVWQMAHRHHEHVEGRRRGTREWSGLSGGGMGTVPAPALPSGQED